MTTEPWSLNLHTPKSFNKSPLSPSSYLNSPPQSLSSYPHLKIIINASTVLLLLRLIIKFTLWNSNFQQHVSITQWTEKQFTVNGEVGKSIVGIGILKSPSAAWLYLRPSCYSLRLHDGAHLLQCLSLLFTDDFQIFIFNL